MDAKAFTLSISATIDTRDPLTGLPPFTTGDVTLNPLSPSYLAPPKAGASIFSVFSTDAPTQFPGWTATSGIALAGVLDIQTYDAHDYGDPRGGADMKAVYTRSNTDPATADLRFISLFTDNTGPSGALVSHIDPFPNDDPAKQPWYYTDPQHNANSTADTMTFIDFPSDPVTSIPFFRTVSFETYLASFDSATKSAVIRDGWSWGYVVRAQPVPGPLPVLGLVAAFRCSRKIRHKIKKVTDIPSTWS